MKKALFSRLALIAALATSSAAFAQTATGPDYSTLLTATNWTTTNAAILSIGAGLMTLFILMKGVKILHRFIKGA
jgi:Inovirus Coat protein B